MNRKDGSGIFVDSFLYFVRIYLEGLGIGVGKNRQGFCKENHIIRGNKCIRRNNNLVSGIDAQYVQGYHQGRSTTGRGQTAFRPH